MLKTIGQVMRLVFGFLAFRKRDLLSLLQQPLAFPVLLACGALAGLAHTWHLSASSSIVFGLLAVPAIAATAGLLLWYSNRDVAGYHVHPLPFVLAVLATTPLHWIFFVPSVMLTSDQLVQSHYEHWIRVALALYQLALVMFFLRVYAHLDLSRRILFFCVPLLVVLSLGSCAESIALMDFKGKPRAEALDLDEALVRWSGFAALFLAALAFLVGVILRRKASNAYRQHGADLALDFERSLDGENGVLSVCQRLTIWQRTHFAAGLADVLEETSGLGLDGGRGDAEERALEACAIYLWQAGEPKEYAEISARVRGVVGLKGDADAKTWAADYLSEHRPDLVRSL